jgi:carbamate kinase
MESVAAVAADALAPIAETHDLIVTHGNGPQIGDLAEKAPESPLDVLGAQSEGLLGYVIEQALSNRMPDRTTLTMVTRVVVAADDPAFAQPTKPIGPVLHGGDPDALSAEHGWPVVADRGGYRRVVPSPHPLEVVEADEIGFLARSGAIVVCAGGGGVPVTRDEKGQMLGADGVIDKDLSSAVLALQLRADVLLLLTDVAGVCADWPTCEALLRTPTTDELKALNLPAGSMAPKVAAAVGFVESGGAMAGIGLLNDAARILAGEAGTVVRR